jgi:NTE family protein
MRAKIVIILLLLAAPFWAAAQQAGPAPAPAAAPAAGPSTLARPRVAVVLSGGSALGLAHIGALKVIERMGIPIDMIAGTSMGAIVGGLYAAGYSPQQMEEIVTRIDWGAVFSERRDSPGDRYDLLKRQRFPLRVGFDAHGFSLGAGLLEGQNVLALLTTLTLQDLTVRNFDDLPVPYRAVAADIMTGDKVVFSHGSIAEAMRSSMSIPGVFRPYEIDGRRVVDGGIVDNMPVDVARQMGADIVIAVESRARGPRSAESLTSSLAITAQTLNLMVQQNMSSARKEADLVITPDLDGYNVASYADAAQIIDRGEAGAELAAPALREIADRIANTRPLVQPEDQANRAAFRPLPLITAVTFDGGSPDDQAVARSAFQTLAGRQANRDEVRKALDSTYATGRFDLVRFDLQPLPDALDGTTRAVGVVHLVPDTTADDAILFGTSFRAVFTSITDNESELMAGVMLRDLTGKDSAFFTEAGFQDRRRLYSEYFQPFGPFFLMPFFRYESQFDSYYINVSNIFHTQYQTTGGGAWAGFTLDRHVDLMAGYSYESVLAYESLDTSLSNTVTALTGVLRADTMRTSVFPESGFSMVLRGRWADPALGGNTPFTTAELNLNAAVPLSRSLTLGLAGYGATDFSGFLDVNGMLPPERLFTVIQPGMFYGMEPLPAMGTGNHVIAGAVELRVKLGTISPVLGGEVFGLANLSTAAVRQDLPGGPDFIDFLPLRWDGSLGLGLRIGEHTGIMAAASVIDDGNATLGPQRFAFSLQIGSFAQFLEDRR